VQRGYEENGHEMRTGACGRTTEAHGNVSLCQSRAIVF